MMNTKEIRCVKALIRWSNKYIKLGYRAELLPALSIGYNLDYSLQLIFLVVKSGENILLFDINSTYPRQMPSNLKLLNYYDSYFELNFSAPHKLPDKTYNSLSEFIYDLIEKFDLFYGDKMN